MVKRLVPIVAALVLLTSAQLFAQSLGELTLQSSGGQPLNARIIMLDTAGLELGDISVQLASAADFNRFDLARSPALESLVFDIESEGSDGPVLRLRSPGIINEPVISLVLDLRWPAGRVLTEYSIRLEPAEPGSQSLASTSMSPLGSIYEPVEVFQPVQASAGDSTAPISSAAPLTTAMANASTITVNAGDTLWEIALRVRPDTSVSVQQTMLALQRLNPDAFINNNINLVRRDEVLRVPELNEIRQLSVTEAVAEVARQNQARQLATQTPTQSVTQMPSTVPPGAGTQGELRVVTVDDVSEQRPDPSAAGDQSAQTRQQLQNIENRLAVRQEDLDRQAVQNDELNARLGMLQQQIASAQEIIRLRDLEMAQLQQSLAEQAPVPASAEPAPTLITMAPDAGPLERFINIMISNTWALLGGALSLILVLVMILALRNKTARAREAANQRDVDDMPLGDDSDDLMFSGVAVATADSVALEQAASAPDVDDMHAENDEDDDTDVDHDTDEDAGSAPTIEGFKDIVRVAMATEAKDEFDDLVFIPSEDTLADEDNEEENDEDDEDDFVFLSASDEAATKLDLARAYIDMGDIEGAREILNEVLQQGTESQRSEAQVLLDKL